MPVYQKIYNSIMLKNYASKLYLEYLKKSPASQWMQYQMAQKKIVRNIFHPFISKSNILPSGIVAISVAKLNITNCAQATYTFHILLLPTQPHSLFHPSQTKGPKILRFVRQISNTQTILSLTRKHHQAYSSGISNSMFSSNLSDIVSMDSPNFTSIVEILVEELAVSANLLPILTEVSGSTICYMSASSKWIVNPSDVFYVWN